MKKQNQERALSNLEISSFCSQMEMVLKSGFSIIEGISILLEDAGNPQEERILKVMYEEVLTSGQLYPALKASQVFPDYLLQMIEIGEETGTLDEVFEALSQHYKREENILQQIKSALTYPLIMIGMMVLVIVVLMTKVMPVFQQVFHQLGYEMTGFSKGVLLLGNAISKYAPVFIGIVVLIVCSMLYLVKTKKGRKKFLMLGYHIGFFRGLFDKIATCRFAGGMYLTLKSGMNQERSLEFAEKLVDNTYFKKKIRCARAKLEDEGSLGEALQQAEIFNGLYAGMVKIADKSGKLDEIMEQMACQYEEEIDVKVASVIAVIEPTLVIVMSVVIGAILLSVILPLMGIMAGL